MSVCKYLISVIFIFCSFHYVWPSCVFQDGKYDLSPLDVIGGWQIAFTTSDGDTLHYVINVCGGINSTSNAEGCTNSSVCQISGNTSTNFGDAILSEKDYHIASHTQNGFTIYLLTKSICGNKGSYRSSINFACGPNLGVPEIILRSDCQANIYWKTYAACPTKPKVHQVPCYALDEHGQSHDLSHLIKQTGGYFVTTPIPAIDFVINVCSDIVLDNATRSCPGGSAACRIIGSESLMFGKPQGGLEYTKEGLLLTYKTTNEYDKYPAGCNLEPKTTVLFKCPQRGHSHPPKVITDSNCQYEIEWETEYACIQSSLKSNIKTCQFDTETHGVEIDLSPLKQTPFVTVPSNSSNTTSFTISVCGGLKDYNCGGKSQWSTKSVCMNDLNNASASKVVGSTIGYNFMYADDEVILAYPKGDLCKLGMEHSSEISFICDPTANGDGKPRHLFSDECVHYFEWPTKHACLKHPLDTPCSVTFEKKKINLQKLLLVEGEAWEAVDKRTAPSSDAEYYINVCGQVSTLGNLSQCGDGSSACISHANGSFINLGNFTAPPVYDAVSNSVRLEYIGGSSCGNGKFWKSTIEFICRAGHINSEPVLTKIDITNCHYIFEWHTAEACPEGMIEGSNCKVYDSTLDVNFDLNPLKSKVYEVNTELYKFYLGVCEPIKNTPCSKNRNSSENIGVCQEDRIHQTCWKTGEPSSNVSYMDGVVNLTYLSGDHFNDPNKTARMTVIIFICDFNAGHGNPIFVEEVNFTYVFHWYTSLVCPPTLSTATECLAHDPISHLVYDLSGLAMSRTNWMTIVGEDEKELQIYLNVCRSLTHPSVCDPDAAACVVEAGHGTEKVVISNIGRATGPPVFQSPGHLSLTYTNGNPCVSFGRNTTYSTVIHFLCGEQDLKNAPTFLSKLGNCEYSFLWRTNAACPTENLVAKESCQITDPDSGFTFDLTSLHVNKQPYTVESLSAVYQFNVCGKIVEGCTTPDGKPPLGNVSVCEVDKDGNKIAALATADAYTLSYSVGQDLMLTYKPSSTVGDEVVIKFPCDDEDVDFVPHLIEHEGGRYVFEMKTHLTCIPTHVECIVVDDRGNEYDLNPLARFSNNWEVADFRPENMHIRYHINFCRPLNKVGSYKCPGGSSSACQTNSVEKDGSGHDLGLQLVPPIVLDGDSLTLIYTNGSYCNAEFQRSTIINLICDKKQGQLIFIGETPECEYMFSMQTPAACPITRSHGNGCTVMDPVFGYTFDLNPLKSKNRNYNLTVGEYEYLFNVCDKLNGLSDRCANSSACQTKHGDSSFSRSLGLPNDSPIYRNGLIHLEYESGSGNCHGKYNRSTFLTFTCHHGREDKDGPTFVTEAEDCSYLFEWPTVHACPPFEVIECAVVAENGTYYDLSQLSLLDNNYFVKYPYSDSKTFVMNLCRSVVHTPYSLCPYSAASCLVDNTISSEPINLGRVSQPPYIEDGKIKIKYTSGDQCNEEGTSLSRFWQSVVEFNCDPHSLDSGPQFVGKDDCTYYFDWRTVHACSEIPKENYHDCTVKDPETGYLFNLSALGAHGLFKTQVDHHQYHLSVCGNDSSSPCGVGTAVCQEELTGNKRSFNAGKVNYNLVISGTSLYMNYSNGDACHGGRYRRNTIIEFTCGKGVGEPKFLHESSDCTYFFYWKTEYACQSTMHCEVRNGSELYDLSLFAEMYHTAGSSIVNDDASYYVSVCNSLPSYIGGSFCPPGSGICRVTKHHSSAKFSQSLGQMQHSPMIDFMGHITALYTNGSTCETNMALQNRARIIFICDSKVGLGNPVLIDSPEECFYLFEWRTNLVCPEKPEDEPDMSCKYTDLSKGIHFDLSPLQKSSEPYVVDDNVSADEQNKNHFYLKVCSAFDKEFHYESCKEAGVCAFETGVAHNYGEAKSQKLTYDGRRLRLTFYNGDDCPAGMNGKRTSEIFFVCDPNAGHGIPVLHKKYTCLAVFMWKTALVCENMQHKCSFEIASDHYDFNLLSSLSHNWNTSRGEKNFYINLCRGVQETPDTLGCSPTAAVCMVDESHNHITLGTVQTVEAKPINSSDLLLTFESGDRSACSNIDSKSTLTPVTRLFMRCGRSLGNPKIFSGPDSKCFYDFIWESSLACPDKAEQVMLEKDGIIKDERFEYTINITDILNSTFKTIGRTGKDEYIYEINLSGFPQTSAPSRCTKAAICQRKAASNFSRDIGSFDTRTFIVRGSELHLTFTSTTKPCGKNPSKNVTTIINMQCVSAAGRGNPVFEHESGDCDYVFSWDTAAVCPDFHKKTSDDTKDNHLIPDHFKDGEQSSHTTAVITGLMVAVLIVLVIVFIVAKPERRSHVAHRFRTMFGRVNLPYFRYKRGDILTELQSDF